MEHVHSWTTGTKRLPPTRAKTLQRVPEPTNTLFSVNRHGSADIGVPGTVARDTSVLVTAEPVGGTRAPTTAPVIVATLG